MLDNPDSGYIISFSSIAAFRPLACTFGYLAVKAAVSNFTQWLAVHIAQNYTSHMRVNTLAPGLFATKQNHYLLYQEDGSLTHQREAINNHTPAGRFGDPDDLFSSVLWLIFPASGFIIGVMVLIGGGFSAFSGV